jgi:hypothetical protein
MNKNTPCSNHHFSLMCVAPNFTVLVAIVIICKIRHNATRNQFKNCMNHEH